VINKVIKEWHTFALDTHAGLKGGAKILKEWKLNKAEEILTNDAFKDLRAEASPLHHL
jgi:hypothetical protein